jgi:hypothetical protein
MTRPGGRDELPAGRKGKMIMTAHPAVAAADQVAASARQLEDLLVPVPRDRVIHAPRPAIDLDASSRAALLSHLDDALSRLSVCADAIAAELDPRDPARSSLALAGHLTGRAAGELDAARRGVKDGGSHPPDTGAQRLTALSFPLPLALARADRPHGTTHQPGAPRPGSQQESRPTPQPGPPMNGRRR